MTIERADLPRFYYRGQWCEACDHEEHNGPCREQVDVVALADDLTHEDLTTELCGCTSYQDEDPLWADSDDARDRRDDR